MALAALHHAGIERPDAIIASTALGRLDDTERFLADMRSGGVDTVAMEVSSHALMQGRVERVQFDVAVYTQLSRDHLDYHGDMESYVQAKARLFDWPTLMSAVINLDCTWGRRLVWIEAARTMRRVDVSMLGTPTEIMECEKYCAAIGQPPRRIRSPQRNTEQQVERECVC